MHPQPGEDEVVKIQCARVDAGVHRGLLSAAREASGNVTAECIQAQARAGDQAAGREDGLCNEHKSTAYGSNTQCEATGKAFKS